MCKMIARHVTASLACVKVTSLVFCCHNSDSFFVGLSSLKTLDLDLCRLFMFFSAHMPRLICVSPVINSLSSLLPPYAASPSILPPPPPSNLPAVSLSILQCGPGTRGGSGSGRRRSGAQRSPCRSQDQQQQGYPLLLPEPNWWGFKGPVCRI